MKRIGVMLLAAVFFVSSSVVAADYKAFTEDIKEPYGYFKKSLALTSKKENREKAIDVVKKFTDSWAKLAEKYAKDAPEPFNEIEGFTQKINRPVAVGQEALALLHAGDVKKAHHVLEEVRYLLWKMRVEVGLSSLNDRINDFHEAMEIVLGGVTESQSSAELIHLGDRYGAWLAIKWEEVGNAVYTGADKASFDAAVLDGRNAIVSLREALSKADDAAAKKFAGMVKKQYKVVFFMPECS